MATRRMYLGVVLIGMLLVGILGMGLLAISPAEVAAQGPFSTNTPPPPDPLLNTPDAPITYYALRLWLERDLVEVLISQLHRLARGETDQQRAVTLTVYELSRRFPGAPRDHSQQDRLLNALWTAPRGSVDMRSVARPFIVAALNENLENIRTDTENAFTVRGASVRILPANLDGFSPVDAVLHVRYPATADSREALLYEDYIPVVRKDSATYTLPPFTVNLPAAPYGSVQNVSLVRLQDVNGDGLDELAIGVNTGEINSELLIIGWRNNSMASLIAPEQRIFFGGSPEWSQTPPSVTATVYRTDSARWDCQSQREMTWTWSTNFYRQAFDLAPAYRPLNTLGCALFAEEPFFEQSPVDALLLLFQLIDTAQPGDPGYDRGRMALAVMYDLAGQRPSAEAEINGLTTLSEGNAWLSGQIEAFNSVIRSSPYATDPLQLCTALLAQNPDGMCDTDQLIARMLAESPLSRSGDVLAQLDALGLPVVQSTPLTEVGKAARHAVKFDLAGSGWWAFAPLNRETYVAERIETPAGFEERPAPAREIMLPDALIRDLIEKNDPASALVAIEGLARANPALPLSAAARYFKAFCQDMLSDRQNAREGYYALWVDYPDSTWGMLAGAHLEHR